MFHLFTLSLLALMAASPILNEFGQPFATPRLTARAKAREYNRQLLARFDAAVTNTDNERHWLAADALSARAAASPSVRATIRRRARYECHEANCYGKGIVLTLTNDTIGTGPRLQVLTKNKDLNKFLEAEVSSWMRAVGFAAKIRAAKNAKTVDGEPFILQTNNQRLRHRVKLDIRAMEAELVASPAVNPLDPHKDDGIRFDDQGNPLEYHVLDEHPGNTHLFTQNPLKGTWVPADFVIHPFRVDRPGQTRGISEVAPALPLFAQLRRFVLAVIAAAETQASHTGWMKTQQPPEDGADGDDLDEFEPMDAVPIELRSLLVLPDGYDAGAFPVTQPATTFEMFRNAILNEIARCVQMPFNIAAANSAGYNFASGRLDHKLYFRMIQIERAFWEREVLDRILDWWLTEAMLIADYLPPQLFDLTALPHQWHWDEADFAVDPAKTANATKTDLEMGVTNYPRVFASRGLDWETEQEKEAESLGITVEQLRELRRKKIFGSDTAASNEDDGDEKDDDESTEDEEVAAAAAWA